MTERDWYAWHRDYDDPATALAQRLAAVQRQIQLALDLAPPGPLRAISLCAGQGRDLIGVLARHPRRDDVVARLLELDPRNAEAARQAAGLAGLPGVEVVTGDAALTDSYAGLVPAYLVLACGVFGNMTDDDVQRTVGYCPQLCARGGTVVWTRGRWQPDLVPQICSWFGARGFQHLWVSDPAHRWGAAAHRFTGTPVPLEKGARMFTFTGHQPHTGPARQQPLVRTARGAPGPARYFAGRVVTSAATVSCGLSANQTAI
ncbi:MAG: class I SAM-dependent methyltransferase [Streptosporangiaceae bacterium]